MFIHRLFLILLLYCCVITRAFCSDYYPVIDTLNLHWFTSKPFIYEDENGELTGIEYEMLESFASYMFEEKGISIVCNWIKSDRFSSILDQMKKVTATNDIGVSALSITDDRLAYADFTTPYFPDITVMVSSRGTPIVQSVEEMDHMLNRLNAVTIRDTKYETLLNNLKDRSNASFDIEFIESDSNILEVILQGTNKFGFIDLPIYLMLIKRGGEVTRQNFFTTQGSGYAFILPRQSIWKVHLNEFLSSADQKLEIASIISRYLGNELYSFIDQIYLGDQLGTSLLTKEKEMQLELLKNVNLRLEQEQAVRRILIVSMIIAFLLLAAIAYLYYKNQKTTNALLSQQSQIDTQQEDIRQKNEQLMNRNAQLVALNEEKNNLVRILAHDIRSPLSQIIMAAEIVGQNVTKEATEMEVKMLDQITKSAERINKMVTKILDIDSLEDNHMKVLNERVNIQMVMKDIIQRYRPIAAKKNIELVGRFCENHNIIRTDHLLLLLVLENLVSNAVKFSPEDTCVEFSAVCTYESVIFKISDEGPGFSDEDKKKLFSRFQKLSARPTGGESSTGLGLSIVKKYVQDLGGKVWVESVQGKGSTFFVKLTA